MVNASSKERPGRRELLKRSLVGMSTLAGGTLLARAGFAQLSYDPPTQDCRRIIPFTGRNIFGEVEVFFDSRVGRDRALLRLATDNQQFTYLEDPALCWFVGNSPSWGFSWGYDSVVTYDAQSEIVRMVPLEQEAHYSQLSADIIGDPAFSAPFAAFTEDLAQSIRELQAAGIPLEVNLNFAPPTRAELASSVIWLWRCVKELRKWKNKAKKEYNDCLKQCVGRERELAKEWIKLCKKEHDLTLAQCATEYLIWAGLCLLR